jgi:hypothetical protein
MRLKKMVTLGRPVMSTSERFCGIEIEDGLMPIWVLLLTQPLWR